MPRPSMPRISEWAPGGVDQPNVAFPDLRSDLLDIEMVVAAGDDVLPEEFAAPVSGVKHWFSACILNA